MRTSFNNAYVMYVFGILLISISGCNKLIKTPEQETSLTFPLTEIESKSVITQTPLSTTDSLDQILNGITNQINAVGISAAVGIPGNGIWRGNRGVTNVKTPNEIQSSSKFYAGSISKIFTSVIVFSLIEENRLNLEDHINEWFPEFPHLSDITIQHLLMHTSGLSTFNNQEEYEANKHLYQRETPTELLAYLLKKELKFSPGAHFDYSNIGYIVLGEIIEKITSDSYKNNVEKYICKKIKLKNTEVLSPDSLSEISVKGHHLGDVILNTDEYAMTFAAGSVFSTPQNLVVFFQALMSGRLIQNKHLQEMFTEMNLMTVNPPTFYGKGILTTPETPIGLVIGHAGGMKGFQAALYYHPAKNIFACVMMNDDVKPVEPAAFMLLEAVINQ